MNSLQGKKLTIKNINHLHSAKSNEAGWFRGRADLHKNITHFTKAGIFVLAAGMYQIWYFQFRDFSGSIGFF